MTGLPSVNGTYTLVEFTDYECPPCRSVAPTIPKLVASYNGKLRLVIRQYPLSMHRHAFSAACAAEAAREQNKFSQMHDALMGSASLNSTDFERLAGGIGLDRDKFTKALATSAKQQVKADVTLAHRLNLPGTPSMIVCTPDNKVFLISDPRQIRNLVR